MNVTYLSNAKYEVSSSKSDNKKYIVNLKDMPNGSCSCLNFYFQKNKAPCKHILQVRAQLSSKNPCIENL